MTHEPAIWSCDTGQWLSCFDSCQLTILWMSNIQDVDLPRHASLPFDSLPYPTLTICRRLPLVNHVTTKRKEVDHILWVWALSHARFARVGAPLKCSYCHVIAHHHSESVRRVTWLFTLLIPFGRSRIRKYSPLQYNRSLLISLNYEEIQKVNKHNKENQFLWVSVIYGLEKPYRFCATCKEKTPVFMDKVFLNQEKCYFSFPSKLKGKYLSVITFKGSMT